MRRLFSAVVAFCLFAICFPTLARLAPDYLGVFEAIVDGKNVALERQSASMESRGRLMGLGGMDMYGKFNGAHSPVRFRSSQKITFVVRVASSEVDPATYLFLSTLKVKGKERRSIYAGMGIYGGMKVDPMNARNRVAVNYRKKGKGLMSLEPYGPLPPGEYMLTGSGTENAFLFGID